MPSVGCSPADVATGHSLTRRNCMHITTTKTPQKKNGSNITEMFYNQLVNVIQRKRKSVDAIASLLFKKKIATFHHGSTVL
uniref:Histone domain-containing protein n=1 Tax=Heterorhabditis bacteriophora TaxID=37862 RepID=A0A1I7XJQ9_HETBA